MIRQAVSAARTSDFAGAVALLTCLACAGCATPESVQHVQGQAERAVAATRHNQDRLAALSAHQERREQALNEQLTRIEAAQVTTNAQLQELSSELDKLHGELHAQTKTIAKVAPVVTAPAAGTAAPVPATTPVGAPISSSAANALFAQVNAQARQIALGKLPAPSTPQASSLLQHLDYATYQAIHYIGHPGDWSGSDVFKLEFQPAGFVFGQSIEVRLIGQKSSPPLGFTASDFQWPAQINPKSLGAKIPVAGFQVGQLYEGGLAAPFLDFLGASYFQAAAPGKPFGLSARGVSINTGVSNTAEEFPRFSEFWLGASAGRQLNVVALLTSDSIDGAYRFEVLPEARQTTMQIAATLYLTRTVTQLGLAPLTSMYLQGSDSLNRPDEMAKAVHDSDGLLVHDRHGWLWMPLYNPSRLQVIEIPVRDLRGFGLLQRDRKYDDYQVPGGSYQNHPSGWVEPTNDWGSGVIKLVEIPAQYSSNSNIVAFWTPANPPAPKQAYHLAYRLTWSKTGPEEGQLGRVLTTRIVDLKGGNYAVMIDFGGGALANLPGWVKVKPAISSSDKNLQTAEVTLNKIAETGRWRLSFKISGGGSNAKVTAWLLYGKRVLSEFWTRQRPAS